MAAEISFGRDLSKESWVSPSCGRLLSYQMAPLGLSLGWTDVGSYAEGQARWTGAPEVGVRLNSQWSQWRWRGGRIS